MPGGAAEILRIGWIGKTIVVDQLHCLIAVKIVYQVIALGDDVVFVPVLFLVEAGLDKLFGIGDIADDFFAAVFVDDHKIANVDQPATSPLMVEKSGHFGIIYHLSLIAANDPFIDLFAAILDAGITTQQTELYLQLEIFELAIPPDDERVTASWIFGCSLAVYRAVFHRPEAWIAVPAGQIFAVEYRYPILR